MITERLSCWPDLLALHARDPQRYPALLESAAQGRYDFLLATSGEALQLDSTGCLRGTGARPGSQDFLDALDRWHDRVRPARKPTSPLPFSGGWFLFLGYELAGQIEPSLGLSLDGAGELPVALALRCPAGIVRDRHRREAWIVAEADGGVDAAALRDDIDALPALPADAGEALVANLVEDDPARFIEAVAEAKRHIRAGDIYQANLSRAWQARLRDGVTDALCYDRLRNANPGPFAGLFAWDGNAVISSSPERLLRLGDGWAETRPIAGTRPRGAGDRADRDLSTELINHPKERAEHVMLIDLERNDLGRFCEPGTVEVNEHMIVESFAHVHHIVSNVRGRVGAGVTTGQAIRALFPGGTITGCPKVRCMAIIDELERGHRGPYTGSFGYLNRDGSLDLNILIRTLVREGRTLTLRAGGGIVADSEPRRELDETRAKARGLLLALESRA